MRSERSKPSLTIFAMIAATLFSKALGLFRSMLLAWTLGELPEAVAFAAASKIPGAFFDIFFSAAIPGAFIPHYAAAKKEGSAEAAGFAAAFSGAILAASAALSLCGVVFSPIIISFSAPKISREAAGLAARLLRIMFPAAVLTAGVYTLSGILQSHGSFILPASVSVLSNLFIISYFFVFRRYFSVYALAAVYTASWALQLLVLAVPLAAKKRLPRPKITLNNKYLRKALRSAPKITAGSWLAPASLLIAAFFCSYASEKAFLIYDYACGIYAIISGIAVYGIGNYIFPALSGISASGNSPLFSEELKKAVFSIIMTVTPVFCAAFTLAEEGVTLLYARGNFSAESAHRCAAALRILSAAMPAFAVSEILYRAHCAAGKTKSLMSASLTAIGALIFANLLALRLGLGVYGVCAAFAISQWAHAVFLLFSAKSFFAAANCKKFIAKTAMLAPGGVLCLAVMLILKLNLHFFSPFSQSISIF